jgi:hypothetical protein
VGGELALPNIGIGVIGKYHRGNAIRDDPCFLQLFMIPPDMEEGKRVTSSYVIIFLTNWI